MIIIEMPLWLAICLTVLFMLIVIHLIFGDLLAKMLFKIVEKENVDEIKSYDNN